MISKTYFYAAPRMDHYQFVWRAMTSAAGEETINP